MAKGNIEAIKRLRELTGVGITDAKKALIDADGDFDKALAAMRAKGLISAEKRAEKEARAGLIGTYVHEGRIGVIVEVNCETDFVAKTDEFKELVKNICLHITALNPVDEKELLTEPFVKDESITVGEYVKSYIAKLGENIVISRFCRMELGESFKKSS
jgi:elongation factor Ts